MICQTCLKDKPKSKFYKMTSHHFSKKENRVKEYVNYSKKCRECCSSKDGRHKVYLIWKERYVGMTLNLKRRIAQHKNSGKDTSKVYVLYKTKSAARARMVESFLHVLGFKGVGNWQKYL